MFLSSMIIISVVTSVEIAFCIVGNRISVGNNEHLIGHGCLMIHLNSTYQIHGWMPTNGLWNEWNGMEEGGNLQNVFYFFYFYLA